MIGRFVRAFEEARPALAEKWKAEPPGSYEDIVAGTIATVRSKVSGREIPAEKVHAIDDGEYQGTLLFLVPQETYQPCTYWYVFVSYGSCSGCDTMEWIGTQEEKERTEHFLTLAYDVVRGLKRISPWGRYSEPTERHETALKDIATTDPDADEPAFILARVLARAADALEEEAS